MKKTFTYLLGGALFALFLLATSSASAADFANFGIIINNQEGTILTGDEMAAQGNAVSFGVAVAGSAVSRVGVSDASSIATVTGNFHSDHGLTNFQCVVAVPGTVKITLGNCSYGGHEASYQPDGGDKVVFSTSASCWKNGHSSVTEVYYTGPATTLTIKGAGYTPYFAIESAAYVPDNKTASFSIAGSGASGIVPEAITLDIKSVNTFTIPSNFTLYKEGYTLTGWNDGNADYNIGDTYTITDDVTMTPLFTPNETTLSDRAAATTVTWDFQRNSGAPTMNLGSGQTGVWVGQATIGGKTIDVKADFNTGSGGKLANASWGDWAQLVGTGSFTFTVPVVSGTTITVVSYGSMSTTTFADETGTCTGSPNLYTTTYTYTGAASTINVVIADGSYHRTISATYPGQPTRTISVGTALYSTYYSNIAYTLPANLQAATIDAETSGTLTLNYRYNADDVVPGGTPVLLKATAAGDYTLTMQPANETAAPTGNLLYGSDVATTTTGGGTGAKYYALSYNSSGENLGFYWVNADGAAFTCPAHKAWLALPKATTANFFSLDDETTGVKAIENSQLTVGTYYDLQGRKVAQPTKGLYIVNGKKVIIK